MSRKFNKPVSRRMFTIGAAMAIGLTLAACGGGDSDSDSGSDTVAGSQADLDAALEKGGELTFWSWTPSAKDQVAAFEKAYPNVKVNYANVGTNVDEYTKLTNAIEAGSGAPDVAQVEYYAVPQYALSESLVDLKSYGLGDLEADYTASTWGQVSVDGKLFGLPQDSGPMAMFYNKKSFDAAGIEKVPTTWDEYIDAAKKIHAHNPDWYITNDNGDGGQTLSMIWQAGGHPLNVDGNTINVNFEDEGTKKYTAMWNQLHTAGLLSDAPGWTDEWFRAQADGSIATLLTGAWMPGNQIANAAAASGDWRVAPMPTYDGGAPATAESGGSSMAVIKQSKNPALAAAFVRWLNHDPESIKIFIESGGFPATTADLSDPSFTDAESEYYGGQKINQVLADAAGAVQPNWSYLPIQAYANTIFGDTAGKTSYVNRSDLNKGLAAWKAKIDEYAKQQGFTVE
ncbi:sugar ABC transporter substrate-binding protein [Kineosporia rhizophila]|uniref:ABC transporter substrate-binding protein n=1 Tax=Kineosporia TaxID=49184 RepID=UPI001E610A09|nr:MULTISPECIES: sugar ABC transporter substrate-binding protein [Kineosporia]MCE0538813.1 sugar ABC transporter substrate-binding protein [Kineosporia rhizophila]GLY18730.1 sugar ABC transporter substrate-binding protein [Kineosporia sp. NBRC 101677]